MKNSKFNNVENEVAILPDGRKVWLSRSVAVVSQVIAIDYENSKTYALIVQRGPTSFGSVGLWCFPCGYLDYNETTLEAAIRETWEESGVDINALKLLFEVEREPWHVDSDPSHSRQNVSIHHAFAIEVKGEANLPATSISNCEEGEVSEVRWVETKDITSNKYPMAFDHNLIMKLRLQRSIQGSETDRHGLEA